MTERLSKKELENLKEEFLKKLEKAIRKSTKDDIKRSENRAKEMFTRWVLESLEEVEKDLGRKYSRI